MLKIKLKTLFFKSVLETFKDYLPHVIEKVLFEKKNRPVMIKNFSKNGLKVVFIELFNVNVVHSISSAQQLTVSHG